MLRYVTLRYVMLCYVMLCYVCTDWVAAAGTWRGLPDFLPLKHSFFHSFVSVRTAFQDAHAIAGAVYVTALRQFVANRHQVSFLISRCATSNSFAHVCLQTYFKQSQSPRCQRRGFSAARLLGLRVRIPPRGMYVCRQCCVLSGKGLCVGLITRPEESYRVWCAWVWSWSLDNEAVLAHRGCCAREIKMMFLTSQ